MQPNSATEQTAWACQQCGRTSPTAGFCPDDSQPYAPATQDLFVGTLVDQRFIVKQLLGVGGWSRVYLAHHKRLDCPIVLKVLHGHLVAETDKLKRFQREVEISTRMRHPNIGEVIDFGVLPAGQPFLVMEYLTGETLNTLLAQRGHLDWQTVVQIVNQAAEGFAYAHEQGIIHRDVKPSNLLLTDEGKVKVLDFGLAKAVLLDNNRVTSLTKTGQTMGTPEYMSPEQCLGQTLSTASDVYSLGLVAYELLTGTKAVSGTTTYEIMKQHVDKPPPPFKDSLSIPAAVQEAVLIALNKNPKGRYNSMRAMKAAFDESSLPSSVSTDSSFRQHLILPVVSMVGLGMAVCAALAWMAHSAQLFAPPAVPAATVPTVNVQQPSVATGSTASRIAALEEQKRKIGHFDYDTEKQLAQLYLPSDPARAMDSVDNILKNRPADDTMTTLLSAGHWGAEPDEAAASLAKTARDFPEYRHVRAQSFLLLGDLFADRGQSEKALQYYDTVSKFSGLTLEPYRLSAEERINTLKRLKLH